VFFIYSVFFFLQAKLALKAQQKKCVVA